MLKWIGYILIILLVVALVTAPSEEKFKKFAAGKTTSSNCNPWIDYKSYKIGFTLFGIGHIKECKGTTNIYNPQTGMTVKSNIVLPTYGESETYLGLFGKFWKL